MKSLAYFFRISYYTILIILSLSHFSCEYQPNDRISCEETDECPEGFRCFGNYCVDPFEEGCQDVSCAEDMVCYLAHCYLYYVCDDDSCPEGTICSDEGCVEDLCHDNSCPEGTACYQGTCFQYLNDIDSNCPSGYLYYLGECIEIRAEHNACTDKTCQEGEICFEGSCYAINLEQSPDEVDNCFPVTCPNGWVCDDGRCLPLDPKWHEAIVIGDPWFIMEGVVLDKEGIPLRGIDVFLENESTPLTSNDEGQFSVLVQENQVVKVSHSGHKDSQFKANREIKNVLVQFKNE